MENHWQELWNNRKINFDEITAEDEQRLILELKRIVGWDFKNTSVDVDEFRKEYEYLKTNLGLSDKIIRGGYLRSVVVAARIFTFSKRKVSKLAARITRKICLPLRKKFSERKI